MFEYDPVACRWAAGGTGIVWGAKWERSKQMQCTRVDWRITAVGGGGDGDSFCPDANVASRPRGMVSSSPQTNGYGYSYGCNYGGIIPGYVTKVRAPCVSVSDNRGCILTPTTHILTPEKSVSNELFCR